MIGAYALSGGAVWMAVGVALNLVPLANTASLVMLAYCAYYGMVEFVGVPGLPPPGSRWQVPQYFVRGNGATRRILVWGAVLGPGFATRNPFAGFAALPIAVASFGSVPVGVLVGGAIGIAHGTGRALAMFRDARVSTHADYLQAVLKAMQWRRIDGVALLVLGALVMTTHLYQL